MKSRNELKAVFANSQSSKKQGEQCLSWDPEQNFIVSTNSGDSTHRIVIIAHALHPDAVEQVLALATKFATILSIDSRFSENLSHDSLVINIGLFEQVSLELLSQKLNILATQWRIDICVVATTPILSEPGLLVMDMDSTMIQMECIDEIARMAGRYDDVAAVTAQAMQGKLDFATSLQTRVKCLQGIEVSALASLRQTLPLMPGLVKLTDVLKANGWKIAIASGGFTYFADYLQQWLGLDAAVSNTLGVSDGVLTGTTCGDIVDAQYKADTLVSLQQQFGISPGQTVAIGDGANDVLMLKQAALGVAFHAKPAVQPQADAAINLHGLDALLALL